MTFLFYSKSDCQTCAGEGSVGGWRPGLGWDSDMCPACFGDGLNSEENKVTRKTINYIRGYIVRQHPARLPPRALYGSKLTVAEAWAVNERAQFVPALVDNGKWEDVAPFQQRKTLSESQQYYLDRNFKILVKSWVDQLNNYQKEIEKNKFDTSDEDAFRAVYKTLGLDYEAFMDEYYKKANNEL